MGGKAIMSKSIIIDEAGLPKALTVDALRTSKQGGGTEDWVPADGKNLVELDIGGSGTYRASDYGAYGISVARVTPKYGGGATSKAAPQPVFANPHTPAIREGGNPVYMSARLLKTNLQGGGTCLWVPEDEVNLDTKYVDHSGTYPASADDCYGYSQITVTNVDVEITQDEDGDDVAKITDGDTVIIPKLPSSIVIDVLPNKLIYYEDQLIDYTGMVVKAYTKSGQLWTDASHPNGIIPISKLTLPVTIAHADQGRGASSDLDTGSFTQPIPLSGSVTFASYSDSSRRIRNQFTWTPIGNAAMVIMRNSLEQTIILTASPEASDSLLETYTYTNTVTGEQRKQFFTTFPNNQYTYDGKTVYYTRANIAHSTSVYDPLISPAIDWYGQIGSEYEAKAAWTAVYGEISGETQEVPVQWNRPYDNELLEASFSITIQ